MSALWFVITPLVFYIPMFLVELYISIRRIGKPLDKGGEYLHATWEVTHTFLILSLNYFMWLYSSALVNVAKAVFVPLILFGAVFIVRAILYIYLFYIKKSKQPNITIDWLFALCHLVMIISIIYVAIVTASIVINGNYETNDVLLPLLYPGLFLMIPLITVPLYFLYKTKLR
ncbi:hypothetical protein EYC59_05155 [Candidatus Saccharibacteria bacterium]|nr:MAG: hypothetical protein EYC59_05155 [Candidatus Saccharibacteria bacterium]